MSVDAAQAEFLDEPLPHSPLKNRLSEALPKAPVGLQWRVLNQGEEIVVTLQTREGAFHGSKSSKVLAVDEDGILNLIVNTAKSLITEVTRRSILTELSGTYEGEVA